MDANTIMIFISTTSLSTIMIIVAMFTLFHNQNKKFDIINERLSKIESKLDIVDERYNNLKENIVKIETEQKEQRTEIKNIYSTKYYDNKEEPKLALS